MLRIVFVDVMVNLDLNCMPFKMTDSGLDSGPPSKKSKTSSPTSSITSFDPDTAGNSSPGRQFAVLLEFLQIGSN